MPRGAVADMPRIDFDALPDTSRLWIFGAARTLDESAQARVTGAASDFIASWAAHGTPLTGSCALVDDRFLLVAVDQASVPPSGCSIDAMVRLLKGLEGELGVPLVAHGDIYFRGPDGRTERMTRAEFRTAAAEGKVTSATPVFDTTLTELGRLRAGAFEVPARDSWHGPAFFREQAGA